MTAAALSDNLPFYDNPDENKSCEWCGKLMIRQGSKYSRKQFRERKTCSRVCHKKLRADIYPGQQWGYLKILCEGNIYIKPSGRRSHQWVCECVCGLRTSVRTEFLKNGNTRSCGCRGSIVPNQKFGMLRTIRQGDPYIRPNGSKETTWLCECTCGIVTTVHAKHLLDGGTNSCGCKTTTRLEDAIEQSLNRLGINYSKEYKPEALAKRGFHYRLDFYLSKYNLNIEADGKDFHGGGNQYRSSEEQIEHDDNRNRRVSWFFGCYILRLSEDLLDGNPRHLDAKLRRFLDGMGEKPQYWLTYDFKTPC